MLRWQSCDKCYQFFAGPFHTTDHIIVLSCISPSLGLFLSFHTTADMCIYSSFTKLSLIVEFKGKCGTKIKVKTQISH